MPAKAPTSFPSEQRRLQALGDRLRLARKRRRLPMQAVAARAGISRQTLYNVENGDPSVTLGSYLRVLAVLGLEQDLERLAAEDPLGRRLQDLALEPTSSS
jgi:transcriptional regulator with XRE-family HTH domain